MFIYLKYKSTVDTSNQRYKYYMYTNMNYIVDKAN